MSDYAKELHEAEMSKLKESHRFLLNLCCRLVVHAGGKVSLPPLAHLMPPNPTIITHTDLITGWFIVEVDKPKAQ